MKRLCEVLNIARSSFSAWLEAAPGRDARTAADAALAARIRAIHAQDPAMGAPRITAELNDITRGDTRHGDGRGGDGRGGDGRGGDGRGGDGRGGDGRVNHKRVARIMREHGIAGLRLRRRVRTTIPEPAD